MSTAIRNLRHLNDAAHMVYELYDSAGEPLYVGCTHDIAQRLGALRRRPWWPQVAEIHTQTYIGRDVAMSHEAGRIAELQPPWNLTNTEQASEAARERWRRRRA